MAMHCMNAPNRYVIEEKFGGYFNDHDDVSLAEVLQDQEIVYESFQRNGQTNTSRTTSNANSQSGSFQYQNLRENSAPRSINTQLAIDEAIAKELQDLENQLVGISFDATNSTHPGRSPTVAATLNPRSTQAHIPVRASRDDNIDPDNMTYEVYFS